MASGIRIAPCTPRPLPRPFNFHWGRGLVVEEASVKCVLPDGHGWEPTIQLLRYIDGSEILRFCVFAGRRLTRLWPLVEPEGLAALGREVAKNPGIRRLLRALT